MTYERVGAAIGFVLALVIITVVNIAFDLPTMASGVGAGLLGGALAQAGYRAGQHKARNTPTQAAADAHRKETS